MPNLASASCAARKAALRSRGVGAGTSRSTSAIAPSTNTPAGAPARPPLDSPAGGGPSSLRRRPQAGSPCCSPSRHGRRRARAIPGGRSPPGRGRRRSGSGRAPSAPGSSRSPISIWPDWPRHARRSSPVPRPGCACPKGRAAAAEAQRHDMAVRVDHAGDHRLAGHVGPPVEVLLPGPRLAAREQPHHLALAREEDAAEAHHLAPGVERHAVDVVDQRVGVRRGAASSASAASSAGRRRSNPVVFAISAAGIGPVPPAGPDGLGQGASWPPQAFPPTTRPWSPSTTSALRRRGSATRWCARRRCTAHALRADRRGSLFEVRESPVHRRLQGARRAQPAAPARRGGARARRDRGIGRQSRAGPRLSRRASGHPRHHRDAGVHPRGEGAADRGGTAPPSSSTARASTTPISTR